MFYIEEIKYLLTHFPQDRKSIESFCNIEMSHYAKLSSIGNELDRYTQKLEREQLFEETCTFIAQQIQPRKDVCYTNVSAPLDTIAQEVRNRLREKHPNHSIFSTSEETFSSWKTNNIKDNHWDQTESMQIMDTLQEYIFDTLNFRVCILVPEDIKCLCIDYVLQSKYGKDVILYTIFNSVARRLGLRCDVINIENDFCVFWKPKFVTNNLENARCFYTENEKFPNCLHDSLPDYKYCKAHHYVLKIRTKEILTMIRTLVKRFIKNHKIMNLGLVKLKCKV
ncbi:uncharacterized protein LOC114939321 [Nylanderia fulva]|uniref:uncharacterized protein LOC114939321 n=1 Tax=Nylanderia fulva TaxID=613905 RepID=UPI0010FB5393|nr:uncharacterized protein LOC114939321 [Nylanderia fulva]